MNNRQVNSGLTVTLIVLSYPLLVFARDVFSVVKIDLQSWLAPGINAPAADLSAKTIKLLQFIRLRTIGASNREVRTWRKREPEKRSRLHAPNANSVITTPRRIKRTRRTSLKCANIARSVTSIPYTKKANRSKRLAAVLPYGGTIWLI